MNILIMRNLMLVLLLMLFSSILSGCSSGDASLPTPSPNTHATVSPTLDINPTQILHFNSLEVTLTKSFDAQTSWIKTIAWSPDSRQLAIGGTTGHVRIWDPLSGKVVSELPNRVTSISQVTWSPDGNYLVVASNEPTTTLRVWDIATKRVEFSAAPPGYTNGVSWSSDGKNLAVAEGGTTFDETNRVKDSVLKVYETSQWQVRATLSFTSYVGPVVWSPTDSRLGFVLTTGDIRHSSIFTWDPQSNEPPTILGEQGGYLSSLEWSPDGNFLAYSSSSIVTIVDVTTGRTVKTFPSRDRVNSIAWSLNSRYVVSGTDDGAFNGMTIEIRDVTNGSEAVLLSQENNVMTVDWSPDGKYIATAGMNGDVRIWSVRRR